MCLVNTESCLGWSVQHNNNSSSAQAAAVKLKRKSIGGKKHWITTQLHIINTPMSCLILTTHSLIHNWLPCGPPCRRWARCCHRRQTSPHFQAADTQKGLFIALMRWRDEACCLCYRLNTHWTQCGQQPRVWTRCLRAGPVF